MQILRLLEVYVSLLTLSPEFLILMTWRITDGVSFFTNTRTDAAIRPAPIRAPFPIRATNPCPQRRARRYPLPMRNPSSFVHKRKTMDHDGIIVHAGWDG